jgi:ATP-binding cassette, subfamily B, bacterial
MEKHTTKREISISEIFREYWKVTRVHPWLLSAIILGGLINQAATLAAPLFLRDFFNTLAENAPGPDARHALIVALSLTVLMWLIDWAAQRTQSTANEFLGSRAMASLYEKSFEYLMGHSYTFFVTHFAGALTSKLGRYVRSYERLFDAIVTQFFPTAVFVIGVITVLSLNHPMLGLMLAGWAVLMVVFQIFLARLNHPVRLARAEADTKVTATLSDAISNQNTVALFSGVSFEYGRFSQAVQAWRAATLRAWLADNWIWGSLGLFMIAVQATLLFAAVFLWLKGLLTIGDFVLIQAYLLTTFNRLMGINWQLRGFYSALADASEMLAILREGHGVVDAPHAAPLQMSDGTLSIKDATFGFHADAPVLSNLTITIAGSERVALVGPSGAGKSTITKLLLRMYDLKEGSITIDGQDIRNVTQESLRTAISYVPQEPILFHRTLMENIRYGRRDASDEEVYEAAKKAHCHEFIARLPLGYDTFVGERGIKLSGGERQRVAIARAILKDSPILILDEATSSLDSESEALIQDALEVLMKGKTVIVIAHRLSTILKMDRIIVLEDGKVVAEGTHQELLAHGGLYKKLWSIQAGGFLVDEDASLEESEGLNEELDESGESAADPLAKDSPSE